MADLSCDDSTSVGTPAQPQLHAMGAARRDPRRGAIPVTRSQARFPFLPLPGEVVSGIQAIYFKVKFQKGAALLCHHGSGRAAFHIGEQNECQCELLRCYPSSAQTGGIRTLHEKGSGQNCCPDCETDRGGYHSFDIILFNYH